MTISDPIMVFAVLGAPFLAVYAQKKIELWREQRQKKLWVFKTLMATRGVPLSPEHVQALNMIDLEFTSQSDKPVLTAWKEYNDQLNSYPRDGEDQNEKAIVWSQRKEELLAALLRQMGESLNYKFDSVQIKKGAYSPEAHAIVEFELQLLRKTMLEWLLGKRNVSVSLVPANAEIAKYNERYINGILGLLDGHRPLRVEFGCSKEVSSLDERGTEEKTQL